MFLAYQINIDPTFSLILDIVLACVLVAALAFACYKYNLSYKLMTVSGIAVALLVLSVIFGLELLKYITLAGIALGVVFAALLLTSQEKEKELRRHKKLSKKDRASLTSDETDQLIANLDKAVKDLSATQTGAIITIERNDDLSEFMQKSGTKVDAPLTPEMLLTIFYKGTPLHDGATIVKGDKIISSAVFYQPTQRPLDGKYGSRHRAALGISEMCDALTIVVSEETGKVSLTYKGEMVAVPVLQFTEKFKEYYSLGEKK